MIRGLEYFSELLPLIVQLKRKLEKTRIFTIYCIIKYIDITCILSLGEQLRNFFNSTVGQFVALDYLETDVEDLSTRVRL